MLATPPPAPLDATLDEGPPPAPPPLVVVEEAALWALAVAEPWEALLVAPPPLLALPPPQERPARRSAPAPISPERGLGGLPRTLTAESCLARLMTALTRT
jgi:hypothetical protein